jgi:hypothetical protein
LLDRGRQQAEHDRCEGDEKGDRELHERDRLRRSMALGQAAMDEKTKNGACAQNRNQKH